MTKVITAKKHYKTKMVTFYMVMLILVVVQLKQVSEVLNHGVISHGQGDHV
jgi:hypothetical protein